MPTAFPATQENPNIYKYPEEALDKWMF